MMIRKARDAGGELLDEGPEGPARAYSLDDLPEIVPVRVASQRTLDAYLQQRSDLFR
jgi:hypothetical protein